MVPRPTMAPADRRKTAKEAKNDLQSDLADISKHVRIRRFLAYLLKGVAIFGGIVLGTGVPETTAQIIGIAIAVAIGIDTWLSNQKTLVVYATAQKALDNTLEEIEGQERRIDIELDKLREDGKEEEATEKEYSFHLKVVDKCNEISREVRDAISTANVQVLINLASTTDGN